MCFSVGFHCKKLFHEVTNELTEKELVETWTTVPLTSKQIITNKKAEWLMAQMIKVH